jgi:hypothetical protein
MNKGEARFAIFLTDVVLKARVHRIGHWYRYIETVVCDVERVLVQEGRGSRSRDREWEILITAA